MNILIDMPAYEPLLTILKSMQNINIDILNQPEERPRTLPRERIKDIDILFCTAPPQNHHLMSKLKMIQISSVGYGQVVGEGFEERGVRICNARGIFDIPIAEWNIAMMINLYRDLRGLIRNQEHGIWDRSPRFQQEIRGCTVGIWGYGGIGRETARLAKSLGMKVHVLVRRRIRHRTDVYCISGTGDIEGKLPDQVFLMEEKEAFLRYLDFLVMAIPLTENNVGILGEEDLRILPRQAFLLNPARGPLVKEDALLMALQRGWIAGAALDTHYYYPMPKNHPLWGLSNVIMTPHISGSSASTRFLERIWDIFAQNIKRLQNDLSLLNELTPMQLSGES